MTHKIDEEFYSRQLYAIGQGAMKSISSSRILISGISGLGLEIAKCLILSGIKSITLHDTENISESDLLSNYYVSNIHIGKNRANSVLEKLSSLNFQVSVKTNTDILTEDIIKDHDIVIICDKYSVEQNKNNELARKYNIKFILANTFDDVGFVFCDFGAKFHITDQTGELPKEFIITEFKDKIITTSEKHCLNTGDIISINYSSNPDHEFGYVLRDVIVKKIYDSYSFSTTRVHKLNIIGSVFVKQNKIEYTSFKTLEKAVKNPQFTTIISDSDKQNLLHTKHINNELISSKVICPVNSIIGSIVAQEAIKACTHKYMPINQWLYLDFPNISESLQSIKIFIVGAGAIGCELLKNLAMMNVGHITITDMDMIEKSNLNRQFLFKNSDIGKFKSDCAREAILEMNPKITIVSQKNKICDETLSIYNSSFFKDMTCVMTALDNVQARLFVDNLCCHHQVPMIDSGTLGTKGNVQCVIPFVTELYGQSIDPPEESIPVCTLKSFPYLIDHCIQWARDLFDGLFTKAPKNFMRYQANKTIVDDMTPTEVTELMDDVSLIQNYKPIHQKDCIRFAYMIWHKYYHDQIKELVEKFPKELLTNDNLPFWSGTKKFPTVLEMEANKLNVQFIVSVANLWSDIFSMEHVNSVQVKSYIANPRKKNPNKNSDFTVKPLEFEKDDDSHIEFITHASNLRAKNYKIHPADKFKTRGIAGKIIPALITTTSLISGFACLELIKIITKQKSYNIFVNLALPIYVFSDPVLAKKQKIGEYEYSVWDKLKFGNITTQQLIDNIEEKTRSEVQTISYGQYTLYSNGMSSESRLKMLISEAYTKVCKLDMFKELNLQIFLDIDDSEPINVKIENIK